MALTDREERKLLADQFKAGQSLLEHNEKLFEIYEGDLLKHLLCAMKEQLSDKSFEHARDRAAPINVLPRLMDKLSKLYAKPPVRTIDGGTDSDKELLDFYTKSFDLNTWGGISNTFFNLFKNTFVEPYLDQGKPRLRAIPSHQFLVYSNDVVNPLRVTHFTKIMGKVRVRGGQEKMMLHVYTKDEFTVIDEDGEVLTEIMARPDIAKLKGQNPVKRIPGVYLNRSKHILQPKADSDTFTMTVLLPVLLSDLSYAVKFQTFSILVLYNMTNAGLKWAPNVVWNVKTDPGVDGQAQPKVDVIKPEVDSDKVLTLIKSLLAMWMQSRNIKPGAMGDLNMDNLASGVAKIIDEMDTSEDRQKQVPYFIAGEEELWDLVLNGYHPIWMADPKFEERRAFSKGVKVMTKFAEQRPIVDSTKQIGDQKTLMELGLQTPEGALRELYPDWTDEQVKERLKQVSQFKTQLQAEQPKDGEPQDEKAEAEV